jgi:hypothetical protein
VLEVASRAGLPPDGAVWNFPMGTAGTVTLEAQGEGTGLTLAHRFYDPDDNRGETEALFCLPLPRLPPGWHELKLTWDAANPRAPREVSYLRLRSTCGTLRVRAVEATVSAVP